MAAAVSLPFALAARVTKTVSPSGAVAGLLVSSLLLAGGGWPAWLQLGAALVLAAGSTHVGRSRNALAGLFDDSGGRGWRNVAANTGLGAAVAFYAQASGTRELAALLITSTLAAGASDTVASEIGKAFGGPSSFTLVPVRRVAPGTPGAVSGLGTLAGVASALAMSCFAAASGLVRPIDIPLTTAGAVIGLFFDSVTGSVCEQAGWLDNDGTNLLATGAAAITVWALRIFFS